jgi:hypothetical protein
MGKKPKSNKKQGPKKEKKKKQDTTTQPSILNTTDTEYSDDDWTDQSRGDVLATPTQSSLANSGA